MPENIKELDIAQRIVQALGRTTEPHLSANGSMGDDGDEVIGSVPLHLRHLHNLVVELGNEAVLAEQAFRAKMKLASNVRDLFFLALKMQVPEPKEAKGVAVLENWDVVAKYRTKAEDETDGGLVALLAALGR